MVRKIIIFLLALSLISVPIQASAAEIYDGNISSTYTSIFEDVANKKVGLLDDYVFFRSGQYTYDLVVGDIEFSSGKFVSNETVQIYSISTESSGYNSSYVYSTTSQDGFSLSPTNQLIYSNLGDYPDLIERSNYYEVFIALLLLVALCLYLLRSIFSFCTRRR